MRNLLINACFGAPVLVAGATNATKELIKMSQNPKDWVMPTGNYANHRYSQLKQIREGGLAGEEWRSVERRDGHVGPDGDQG